MAISETVNVLSVGWRMCKQAGTIERTGVFFVFFFFSCLVIKPSQTFALLLTHTDSQTLFPQKPTNIAPTPTGCNAPLRELCALKWCVKWVYVFVPVCACAFVLVCVCVRVCVQSEVHTNLICPLPQDCLQWKICRLFYAHKLECGDSSKNTFLCLLARNMPVKIKFKFTLAVLVPLWKTCLGAGCGLGV